MRLPAKLILLPVLTTSKWMSTRMPESPLPPKPVSPEMSYTRKVLVAVGICIVAFLLTLFVYFTAQILVLCFAGILFSVFLSAPSDLLAKRLRIQRMWALVMVLATLLIVVVGGGYFMGYTVYKQGVQLSHTLPGALKQLERDLHKYLPAPRVYEEPAVTTTTAPATLEGGDSSTTTITSQPVAGVPTMPSTLPPQTWMAQRIVELRSAATDYVMSESFLRGAGGVLSGTIGIIGNIVIVFGVGLFFAISPRTYSAGAVLLFPVKQRPRIQHIAAEIGTQLQWWFVGQLGSMLSVGLLVFIGLKILGVPMAITLAILAGLLNFIPNFGPILAAIPAVLVAFAPQGGESNLNPALAGWVIAIYLIVQLLEGWVITPFFQKKAIDLPPALIIIAQVICAILLGPIGLLLATPILASVLVVVRMLYVEDILGDKHTASASELVVNKPVKAKK